MQSQNCRCLGSTALDRSKGLASKASTRGSCTTGAVDAQLSVSSSPRTGQAKGRFFSRRHPKARLKPGTYGMQPIPCPPLVAMPPALCYFSAIHGSENVVCCCRLPSAKHCCPAVLRTSRENAQRGCNSHVKARGGSRFASDVAQVECGATIPSVHRH